MSKAHTRKLRKMRGWQFAPDGKVARMGKNVLNVTAPSQSKPWTGFLVTGGGFNGPIVRYGTWPTDDRSGIRTASQPKQG